MAWRARNLMELSIWIEYCLKDKQKARRFFEDKTRDALDWMTGVQKLAEFMAFYPAKEFVSKAKVRVVNNATSQGIVDIADPYMRVVEAASELGYREPWLVFNKLLSKFAHPTAFSVLTFCQGEHETAMSEMFLMIGSATFVGAMEDFGMVAT